MYCCKWRGCIASQLTVSGQDKSHRTVKNSKLETFFLIDCSYAVGRGGRYCQVPEKPILCEPSAFVF